ncbi:hypothetical protein BO78DRAFT_414732, partial [Aspergillus sclerotiicarbonarius CBS 121057]
PGSARHAAQLVTDALKLRVLSTTTYPILDPHGSTKSYLIELRTPTPHAGNPPTQPGTVRTPLNTQRLIVQFKAQSSNMSTTISDALWAVKKVAAMSLAREILHNTPFEKAVPDVYAWDDGIGSLGGKAWVIQSAAFGCEPLDQHFHRNKSEQRDILEQIVELQGYFQEFGLPRVGKWYGSCGFDAGGRVCAGPVGDGDGDGEDLDRGSRGPFGSLREMLRAELSAELGKCTDHELIRGWEGKPELRREINGFMATRMKGLFREMPGDRAQFTLNKIELSNFMCDVYGGRITYIIDWSHARISHPMMEFFNSYQSMFGILPFPLDPHWGILHRAVLEGFEKEGVEIDLRDLDELARAKKIKDPVASYRTGRELYAAFKRAGVFTPRDMPGARRMAEFRGLCAAVGGRAVDLCAYERSLEEVYEDMAEVVRGYLRLVG